VAKIYFNNHSLDLARAKIFNSLASKGQVNLFDVIELSSGDYLPKSKMEDGKYKVYGGGGLTQSTHTTSNVEFETIGIGRVGARCGCVFKIEKKSWVTDNALFVSNFKKKYDLSFLIHYLNHINLNQFANQSAQPVISQRGIAKCTIPDTEFYKQHQIGEILDAIESEEDFEDIYNLKPVLEFERNLSLLNKQLDQQQTYLQLLRQTILQEAVQGKLTKQNPTDEPASSLLKCIKAEKEKLIKAGKLKKEKKLPPVTEDETPFKLPKGWEWCMLGEICTKIGSGSTPRGGKEVYTKEGIKFIRSQNVYNEGLVFDSVAYVDEATHKKMEGTKVIADDILLNITGGSIGRCALVPLDFDEANVSQHVTIVRTVSLIIKEFIHQLMISPYFQDYIMATQTGGNREGLAKKNMELMLIPLPPFAEQQRIVAQVQGLQKQLSELEAQVAQSRQYAQQLLQGVLRKVFKNQSEWEGVLVEEVRDTFLTKSF